MVSTEGNGIPIGKLFESAQTSEMKLALKTIATVAIPTRPLHEKKKLHRVIADKGYDDKNIRQALRDKGITPYIPKRKKPGETEEPGYNKLIAHWYKKRWIVERTFAWLGWNRRLLIRWERKTNVYAGFFTLGCIMLCLKWVLK